MELTGKEKLIAVEILKEVKEIVCDEDKEKIDQLVLKYVYS